MKNLHIRTQMMLVVIAALCFGLIVQQRRIEFFKAELQAKQKEIDHMRAVDYIGEIMEVRYKMIREEKERTKAVDANEHIR